MAMSIVLVFCAIEKDMLKSGYISLVPIYLFIKINFYFFIIFLDFCSKNRDLMVKQKTPRNHLKIERVHNENNMGLTFIRSLKG